MVIQKVSEIREDSMNLEESNQFVKRMEQNNKNKRAVLIVLIICAILIAVLIGLISVIRTQEEQQLKMFVDDKQVTITSTLLLQDENGKNYMNVKELATLLGYSYQKGEYKNYTEDEESCYLKTPYEIISMTANAQTITKYMVNANKNKEVSDDLIVKDERTNQVTLNIVVDSEDETEQIFSVNEPIQYVNHELYVSFEELPRIFDVQLQLSENRIKMYSMTRLAQMATQFATNLGYSKISNRYENLTAMVDNMLVVGDGTNYGVVSLNDGNEIISLKYEEITYRQNTMEFFVMAEESVGIIDKNGETIIKPTEYDSITNFDAEKELYLVSKDDKYGIINHEGNTIVYAEYDSIGIKDTEDFADEDIRNFNLLFDECIPVKQNGKVGIIDIEGNERLKCVYDALGYVKPEEEKTNSQNSSNRNSNTSTNQTNQNNHVSSSDQHSVLTIPESVGIKGIVAKFNDLYGIYDVQAKRLIIPCVYSKIYSKTKSGVTKYYLEFEEQEIALEDYLAENNLISVKK